jgi:hypothetical protein
MPDDELASILRDIRDTQRDLWKVAVEAEARNKAALDSLERERRSRRITGILVILGWLVIVALLAIQTSMMWTDEGGSDQEATTPVVHAAGDGNLHAAVRGNSQ